MCTLVPGQSEYDRLIQLVLGRREHAALRTLDAGQRAERAEGLPLRAVARGCPSLRAHRSQGEEAARDLPPDVATWGLLRRGQRRIQSAGLGVEQCAQIRRPATMVDGFVVFAHAGGGRLFTSHRVPVRSLDRVRERGTRPRALGSARAEKGVQIYRHEIYGVQGHFHKRSRADKGRYPSSLANACKCSSSWAISSSFSFAHAKISRSASGAVTPAARPRSASRIARSHVSAVIA